jgi:hypothetical protein
MDFEAIAARVEKMLRASGLADDTVRDKVRAQIEAMKKQMAEAGSPRQAAPLAIRGSERPSAMEFHPSGNQLFCATSAGCRVYDWNAVRDSALAGGQQMPAPVFAASSTPASQPMHRRMVHTEAYVYALAFDARAERLLFGGLTGCVDYLDLRSGLSGTLLELPGRPVVLQLSLNEDATALACCVQPDFFEQGKRRRPPKLQIWDYRGLAERLSPLR